MKTLDPGASYDPGEAAQQLSIKVSTVKQYLRSGRLKGHKEKVKGFREEWRVMGASIIELRRQLGLDKKR